MIKISTRIITIVFSMIFSWSSVFAANYLPGNVVGHNDAAQIEAYLSANPSIVQALSANKWFFAHASVGGNMSDGMRALKNSNPTIYPLSIVKQDKAAPPDITLAGVYEYNRGNPGFREKISLFESYFAVNGWNKKINIAMNKHCYIDATYDSRKSVADNKANAESLAALYIASMVSLEINYPQVIFVYSTMPITRYDESTANNNVSRFWYNESVRSFCKKNNKFLLDVADIECHNANGTKITKEIMGQTVELLVPDYTTDGGHLIEAAKLVVAKGWYAISASIALYQQNPLGINGPSQRNSITSFSCYPNPIDNLVKISFYNDKTQPVTLEITDIMGRKTAILVNSELAPDTYNYEWNAVSSTKGLYFCTLIIGSEKKTIKLVKK